MLSISKRRKLVKALKIGITCLSLLGKFTAIVSMGEKPAHAQAGATVIVWGTVIEIPPTEPPDPDDPSPAPSGYPVGSPFANAPKPEIDCLRIYLQAHNWVPESSLSPSIPTRYTKAPITDPIKSLTPINLNLGSLNPDIYMPQNASGEPLLLDPNVEFSIPWMIDQGATIAFNMYCQSIGYNQAQIEELAIRNGTNFATRLAAYSDIINQYGYGYRALAEISLPGMGAVLQSDGLARQWIYDHELGHANGSMHTSDWGRLDQLVIDGSTDGYAYFEIANRLATINGTTVYAQLQILMDASTDPSLKAGLLALMQNFPVDC